MHLLGFIIRRTNRSGARNREGDEERKKEMQGEGRQNMRDKQ